MELALLLLGAYLLGSIPVGVLVARAFGVDIMKVGSGNIGATNVGRALGKKASIPVFLLDMLKGLIPTLVARAVFPHNQEYWFLSGAMAIIGHSFSPFLKFKGGKGISTALGMTLGTSPFVALSAFALFSLMLGTTRYMSLASIVAVLSTIPLGILFKDSPWVLGGYSLMSTFIIYRHRANIKRLKEGTEPKFSFKKSIDTEKPPQEEADKGAP